MEEQFDPLVVFRRQISNDMIDSIVAETDAATDPFLKCDYDQIRDRLAVVLMMFAAGETRFPKITKSELDRQINVLANSIAAIQLRLASADHIGLRSALEAASLHFNLDRLGGSEPLLIASRLFYEADEALSGIKLLVDHLINCQETFRASDQLTQDEWCFQGNTETERSAYQAMYPYLRWREEESTEAYALTYIGQLYTWLFRATFGVSSATGGSARYSGPSIRFACAVIAELQLSKYFGSKEQEQLANKIGDMWTNLKRRSKRK